MVDASSFSLGSSSSLLLLLIAMGCYRYCSYSKTFMLLSIFIFLLVVVDCCSLLKLLVKNCNNIETHHNNCSCLYHHHLVNNLNRRPLGIVQVYCAINQLLELHLSIQRRVRMLLCYNGPRCGRDQQPHQEFGYRPRNVNDTPHPPVSRLRKQCPPC